MPCIIYPDQITGPAQAGGKAAALAALGQAGLPIPAWFVLVPAWDGPAELTPVLLAELERAVARLCPRGESVAVRSSARDEDGLHYSFAGQFDSFLAVPPAGVAAKVAAVWQSAVNERSLAYRREHGLDHPLQPPAVLIQRMVNADLTGVAFSADPVSGRRGVTVVAAGYGLGLALVSGEVDADTYRVDRTGQIIDQEIVVKRLAYQSVSSNGNGPQAVPVPAGQAGRPALTDEQVRAVADLARQAERFFGRPQDIEWAIEDGRLYLLQSRPITSLAGRVDPDGLLNLWDNSNIAESYPGVTTPLTFSFARRAYEEVYRQFCRLMGVPEATIARSDDTFRQMLGLIRGRIYYNLLNWYRLLALLPGYTLNRRFMEQMMGVREGLPDSVAGQVAAATWSDRLVDGFRLVTTLVGLLVNYWLLPRRIAAFYQRLDHALGSGQPDLAPLRPDELVVLYRTLERQLLTRWDAPLVNDFFAMIFYGLLRRLAETWCADREGSLANELLYHTGSGMISAEPAARLRELATLAGRQPGLVTLLNEGSLAQILPAVAAAPELAGRYRAYLDKFGDRCLEELKLESRTLHDDPMPLLRAMGQLARTRPAAPEQPAGDQAHRASPRQAAEQRVAKILARRPLRRLVFAWVLANARARVRDRENLRFERTRLFGRVRRIFVELGRRLAALDVLAEPADIFYLEVEEAFGFVTGTTSSTDLKGLVALRRAEFDRFRAMEPPADRFETRGIVYQGNSLAGAGTADPGTGDRRQGLGCSPGRVRGPVRLVSDPRQAALRPGDILVAARTDPGWIMLFPAAAGLVVEYGSLLSHSAIVARELGLPAVVSLKGATSWLKDGDWIELDGSSGLVSRVSGGAGAE